MGFPRLNCITKTRRNHVLSDPEMFDFPCTHLIQYIRQYVSLFTFKKGPRHLPPISPPNLSVTFSMKKKVRTCINKVLSHVDLPILTRNLYSRALHRLVIDIYLFFTSATPMKCPLHTHTRFRKKMFIFVGNRNELVVYKTVAAPRVPVI